MTFFERRKFNFFDLRRNVDQGKLASKLNDAQITATASGHNQFHLGDSVGQIHTVIRNWHVSTFSAYTIRVLLAARVKHLLITIGEDEEGINPVIKVWDMSRLEKTIETPFCTRITKAIPKNTPAQTTTLCVHENAQLMSVGFLDGSLILYRGDITRDRSSKPKLLRNASSKVTGLAFKNSSKVMCMFVSTESAVYVYNVTTKDKESLMQHFEQAGCPINCSILVSTGHGSHFMVARNDAIYCYTADGRGPCYAIEGTKVMLDWFRTYVIIISKSHRTVISKPQPSSEQSNKDNVDPAMQYTLTVLDIKNKFIVFTASIQPMQALINELGGFYMLDSSNNLLQLDEKDLQSKLHVLFKKNLYDVAIRIAESQKHDPESLADIFRQYGDHLYGKGDHAGAIEQYIKTIGRLEPSYVIRKFLDSQHIEKLTMYLEAVHKKGRATEDHTTLLLNCFTKLNKTENLKEFILQKDTDLMFDVDIAIKVCRYASPDEALMLARRHKKHDVYIKFLLEDHGKYADAINYIASLDFDDAETYMRKYGHELVSHTPKESTDFLKRLCTNFNDSHEVDKPVERADAYDFISFYIDNSERLVEFIEHLMTNQCNLSSPVHDTLLEHYLYVWDAIKNAPERLKYSQRIMQVLQNPDARYDNAQALLLCHRRGFTDGILYIYETLKHYRQILEWHRERSDFDAVIACCRRFGHQDPSLWVQALNMCVTEAKSTSSVELVLADQTLGIGSDDEADGDRKRKRLPVPTDILDEILTTISKEHLLSPQLVIEMMCETTNVRRDITVSHIKDFMLNILKTEKQMLIDDREVTARYRSETEKLRKQIDALRTGNTVIQGSRCAACHHQLELPSLHFLCQHSYHEYCFQSFSDSDNECPVCHPENQKLLELLKARGCTRDTIETFQAQLERAPDGFSVAAEYFGRGVFDQVTIMPTAATVLTSRTADMFPDDEFCVKVPAQEIVLQKDIHTPDYTNYGLGAEGRMRQQERIPNMKDPMPEQISEGRMRSLEVHRYSSKEPNYTAVQRQAAKPVSNTTLAPSGSNPFDEPSSNPFDDGASSDNYDEDRNSTKSWPLKGQKAQKSVTINKSASSRPIASNPFEESPPNPFDNPSEDFDQN